jgi:hypothetical protein
MWNWRKANNSSSCRFYCQTILSAFTDVEIALVAIADPSASACSRSLSPARAKPSDESRLR